MCIITWTIKGRSTNAGVDSRDTALEYDMLTNKISGTNTDHWGTVWTMTYTEKAPATEPVPITTYEGTTVAGNKTFKIIKNENVVVCLILDSPNGSWWTAK